MWSPDATRIAFYDWNYDVLLLSVADGNLVNITNHPAPDNFPAWSPDGTRIAFQSNRDGYGELYVMNSDGSNVVRLTYGADVDFNVGHLAWSPDGTQIAFNCSFRICTINADGTGLATLTGGVHPAWSPDGARIAFVSQGPAESNISVMNADGTDVRRLTNVLFAGEPDWSPDGTRIVFTAQDCSDSTLCGRKIYVVSADGSALQFVAYGSGPVWAPAPAPRPPAGLPSAVFWYQCNLLTCTFDGSLSFDGGFNYAGIVSWSWDFGDGQMSTASSPTHTYAAIGTYQVTLTVTDNSGLSTSLTIRITPDPPPEASIVVWCASYTCTFDGSSSRDNNGIVSWRWDFGDGQVSTLPNGSHTYAAAGTYDVTLTVTDGSGSADSETKSVIIITPIGLSATGSRDRGIATTNLSWSGASGANVDVFRNNLHVITTPNDGAYSDTLGRAAKGKFTYQVCNAGTTTCSLPVTVTL